MGDDSYAAVVIGSGFGGAIAGCRFSKDRPGKVLSIECGKRYPMGSLPRSPKEMADNFRSPERVAEGITGILPKVDL